jgi:hypothetical protein
MFTSTHAERSAVITQPRALDALGESSDATFVLGDQDQPNDNDLNRFQALTNGTMAARRDDDRVWRP